MENIGPAKKPRSNNTIIDGNRVLQAIHCPAIPSKGTNAKEIIPEFMLLKRNVKNPSPANAQMELLNLPYIPTP